MARCTQSRLTQRECPLIGRKGGHSRQLSGHLRVLFVAKSQAQSLSASVKSGRNERLASAPCLLQWQKWLCHRSCCIVRVKSHPWSCLRNASQSRVCLASLSGVGNERGATQEPGCDCKWLSRYERVSSCCAHLTKLVSLNWSQSPADLTPWEELDGSGPAARSRLRFFTGYCCCCSLASDCYLSPWGRSPCCWPPGSRHSVVTPFKGPRSGGAHGSTSAHCFGTRTVAAPISKSARHCTPMSASFLSSASWTSVVSYFLLRLEAGLPCPLL